MRVVVVDDQPLARAGHALILDSADGIEVVGEAGTGEDAVELVLREQPDVVLMDVRMPGFGGIEATRRIVAGRSAARVIVLTTFDLDEYAFGSLRAGASGFLLKSARPEALVEAVRTVHSGEAVVAPRLTSRLIDRFLHADDDRADDDRAGRTGRILRADDERPVRGAGAPAAASPLDRLSPRERDVFAAIVRGLTNGEIGAELHLAPSTVKSHVNAIFAKLHLRDRVHAVILGHELGRPRRD
ncbi:response regulator transcription factor [Leucobacter sp. CSA1]|uniref:Response regulator transcription factor n=1 Tax=Leucobacter chromiisoli TaxID=2796471 RepID=A0A934Q3J3_9MICO|nr:response regulator transcription factor [Leucobacter chromiisoli]